MKIRTDYVTNSSSSSYVIARIDNKALAKAYIDAGLWWCVNGSVVNERFDSESTDMPGPSGGSIVEWLKGAIAADVFSEKDAYNKLIKIAEEHKDEIDYGTRSAEFSTVHVISDGDGSFFHSEERKGGKLIFSGIDENDWDYIKEGEPIWQFIVGNHENVRKVAKKRFGVYTDEDPWFVKKETSDIFEPFDENFTFKDEHVCLSGDFEYGSKSKVKAYIESQGGVIEGSVNKKTTLLLMGAKGSSAWVYGSYGSKAEKALEKQAKGENIRIMKEDARMF